MSMIMMITPTTGLEVRTRMPGLGRRYDCGVSAPRAKSHHQVGAALIDAKCALNQMRVGSRFNDHLQRLGVRSLAKGVVGFQDVT